VGRLLSDEQIACLEIEGIVEADEVSTLNEVTMIRDHLMSLHLDNVRFDQEAQSDATIPVQDKEPRRRSLMVYHRGDEPILMDTDFYWTAHAIARQVFGKSVRFRADILLLQPVTTSVVIPWNQNEAYHDARRADLDFGIGLSADPFMQANITTERPLSSQRSAAPHQSLATSTLGRFNTLAITSTFDRTTKVICQLSAGHCPLPVRCVLRDSTAKTFNGLHLAYILLFDLAPSPQSPTTLSGQRDPRTVGAVPNVARSWQGRLRALNWWPLKPLDMLHSVPDLQPTVVAMGSLLGSLFWAGIGLFISWISYGTLAVPPVPPDFRRCERRPSDQTPAYGSGSGQGR
jgi:hypothetical protein